MNYSNFSNSWAGDFLYKVEVLLDLFANFVIGNGAWLLKGGILGNISENLISYVEGAVEEVYTGVG